MSEELAGGTLRIVVHLWQDDPFPASRARDPSFKRRHGADGANVEHFEGKRPVIHRTDVHLNNAQKHPTAYLPL